MGSSLFLEILQQEGQVPSQSFKLLLFCQDRAYECGDTTSLQRSWRHQFIDLQKVPLPST